MADLPVVGHEYTHKYDGHRYVSNAVASETLPDAAALTYLATAQAALEQARAERDDWHVRASEAEVSLEDYKQSFWQARAEVERLTEALQTTKSTLPHIGGNERSVYSLLQTIDAALKFSVDGLLPFSASREVEALRADRDRLQLELGTTRTLTRQLGYELDGVIIDTEEGGGFDEVCLRTVMRVRKSIADLTSPVAIDAALKSPTPGKEQT